MQWPWSLCPWRRKLNGAIFSIKESNVRSGKAAPMGEKHLIYLLEVFFLHDEALKILASCAMHMNLFLWIPHSLTLKPSIYSLCRFSFVVSLKCIFILSESLLWFLFPLHNRTLSQFSLIKSIADYTFYQKYWTPISC